MTSRDLTSDQISHRLMRDALREFLLTAARTRPGALEGISSVGSQASAVLYTLLIEHPIDQRGRCGSCRWSSTMLGLRRCQIHLTAIAWLLQPDAATLRSHLATELGLGTIPLPDARRPPARTLLTIRARTDPHDLDAPPRTDTESRGPPTTRHQIHTFSRMDCRVPDPAGIARRLGRPDSS
ncbi:MAG: hypothetical protein ACRDRS_01125 [Pseudonocardiaceae bacterium]